MLKYYTYNGHQDFLKVRKSMSGFGGSSVATLFNTPTRVVNPWSGKLTLFYQMVGVTEPKEIRNVNIYSGHVLENIIAEQYWQYWNPLKPDIDTLLDNAYSGKVVRVAEVVNACIQNTEYDFIFASIDRKFKKSKYSKEGILEIKAALAYAMHKYEGDIPPAYILQVTLYMIVLGMDYSEIAILIDGRTPEITPVEYDRALGEKIMEVTSSEWDRVLEGRKIVSEILDPAEREIALMEIEPEVDSGDEGFLKDAYTPNQNETVGTEEDFELALRYLKAHQSITESSVIKKGAGIEIKNILRKRKVDALVFDEGVKVTNLPDKNGQPSLRVPKKLLSYE